MLSLVVNTNRFVPFISEPEAGEINVEPGPAVIYNISRKPTGFDEV